MAGGYGMATQAHQVARGACEDCGEECTSPNIEAFELSGRAVCDECADAIFEDEMEAN